MVKTFSRNPSLRRSPAQGGETAAIFFLKRDCPPKDGSVQRFVADFASLAMTVCLGLSILLAGCSAPPAQILDIPKDHSANKFYQAAQTGMLSDRVCLDHGGDPAIPAGEVKTGEKYTRSGDLAPGVFRFRENATGKRYLGVSFLQYSGFLQIPKICSWEEKDRG
ncbi:MAG: hypothetical protein V1882_05565 [Candidatus Omnitrophota bacterium]